MKRFAICSVLLAVLGLLPASAQKQWWMDEPVRLVLPLISEKLSTLDSDKLIQQLVDLNANVVLFPTGGIAAQYPTQVPFHYRSAYLTGRAGPGRRSGAKSSRARDPRHVAFRVEYDRT